MKKFYTSLLMAAVGLTAFSASALNYTVDPASGSTLPSLHQVSIQAPDIDAFALAYAQDPDKKIKVLKDGVEFCSVTITDDAMEWNKLYFNFETEASQPGTYVLSIPAESLIDDADGMQLPWNNEDIELTYTIGNGEPAGSFKYTVEPASGSYVESLTRIDMHYPAGLLACPANDEQIKVLKDGVEFCGVTTTYDWDDEQLLIITPKTALTEAGEYTVDIPAGALLGGDNADPVNDLPIKLTYNVLGASAGVTTDLEPTSVYPADNATINVAEYFGNCTLGFPTGTQVTDKASATFSCAEANWSKTARISEFYGSFIVYISELESELPQNGEYKLVIEEGSFGDATYAATGISGKTNPRLEYTYNLTGIKSAGSDDEAELTSVEYVLPDPDAEPQMLLAENSLAAFTEGTRILFNTTNNLAVGYIRVEIEDKNALSPDDRMRVLESRARRTIPEDRGVFWKDDEVPFIEFGRDLILQEGHEYEFRAEIYDFETPPYSRLLLGTFDAKISGTTPGYPYAAAQFVSITPDPQTHLINAVEDGKFTLTFTDYVQLNLTRSVFPIGQMSAVNITENDVTYSDDHKSMTITIPESIIKQATGAIAASLYVTDAEGHAVFTGTDAGDESYFSFTFTCYLGSHDLTIEPADGEITELKDIFISCPDGPSRGMIQYAYSPKKITVRDMSGETIFATFPDSFEVVETGENSDGEYPTKLKMSLEEAITAPGRYVVYIPAAFFNMGSEFESEGCKQTFVSYTINGEVKDETVYDRQPVNTTVDYKLSDNAAPQKVEIKVEFDSYTGINSDVFNTISLKDKDENTLDAQIEMGFVMGDMNSCKIIVKYDSFEFDTPYTVVVPKGTFGDEEWEEDSLRPFACGHANNEFSIPFTIESAGIENVAADADNRLDVYNLQGILLIADADADQIAALPAGIYIIGGKKVTVK